MKKHQYSLRFWIAFGTLLAVVSPSWADVISKADNTDAFNLGTSWVGGIAPGTNDIATWNSALSTRTYTLGADLSWLGLAISFDPGGNIVFNSGNTLTLGAEGITTTPNRTITFNNAMALSTNQTWTVGQNTLTPAGQVDTAGFSLMLAGSGTKQFKSAIVGGGNLILNKGGTKLSNGSVATASDIFINNGASLTFDATPAAGGAARADSITMRGLGNDSARAILNGSGVSSANTLDTLAGSLTIDGGQAFVNLTPNSARTYVLTAANYARNPGGLVLFRGTDMGISTLASATVGDASVTFTSSPSLLGGSGAKDSKNVSILPGAYGNNVSPSGAGLALVTYDTTYGLRLLDTNTEFTASTTNLQTSLDNVRIVNVSGSGIVTNTLLTDTTLNSLSIDITGTGTNSGVTIAGDVSSRIMTLASGTIFSRQIVNNAIASDAVVITNLVIDLNGQEGVILSANNSNYNQGNTPAPLYIASSITNDGGHGITIGGIGGYNSQVQFIGSAPLTYTGPTIVNSGIFRMNKTPSNTGVPGDLIVNGGAILKSSESIPNSASLTLNGGTFYFDNTMSSGNNGHQETINNLYLNGGVIMYNAGDNHTFTINGNAIVNSGDLRLNNGGDVTVVGTTTVNGGRVLVSISSSATSRNAFFTLGNVAISNLVSGAYSPIVLKASSSNMGGQLILKGDLSFIGTDSNTNTVLFDSENSTLINQGIIALDGTRTFDIGNGAAAVDVQCNVAITNNGSTVGALIKAGLGTLALNGTNTFSGGTTVNVGTLAGTGTLSSSLLVKSGATLAPATAETIGIFTVSSNVTFEAGSILDIDIAGANADLLTVSGTVSGIVTVPVASNLAAGEWKVMTASSFDGQFSTTDPRWALYPRNNRTELWLTQKLGTVIVIK